MISYHTVGCPFCRALPVVDDNESPRTQSVVPGEKGVATPSSGEYPKPFSKTAFIGIGMCSDIQHMFIAHH